LGRIIVLKTLLLIPFPGIQGYLLIPTFAPQNSILSLNLGSKNKKTKEPPLIEWVCQVHGTKKFSEKV